MATDTTSPAYPQNVATMHSEKMEVQTPKLAIIKRGRSNPLSQNQIAIMLWVPYGAM